MEVMSRKRSVPGMLEFFCFFVCLFVLWPITACTHIFRLAPNIQSCSPSVLQRPGGCSPLFHVELLTGLVGRSYFIAGHGRLLEVKVTGNHSRRGVGQAEWHKQEQRVPRSLRRHSWELSLLLPEALASLCLRTGPSLPHMHSHSCPSIQKWNYSHQVWSGAGQSGA